MFVKNYYNYKTSSYFNFIDLKNSSIGTILFKFKSPNILHFIILNKIKLGVYYKIENDCNIHFINFNCFTERNAQHFNGFLSMSIEKVFHFYLSKLISILYFTYIKPNGKL